MPTIGSITKTIRIRPKDLEVIERLMEDGSTWSGAVHKLCEEAQNKGYIRELEIDCKLMGVDVEEFVKMVCRAIDEGEIVYEDGKLVKMA